MGGSAVSITDADVERWARALGVWRGKDDTPQTDWEWARLGTEEVYMFQGWGTNMVLRVACRRCQACTIDGQPTGRRTLTWEAAVLAAMDKDWDPPEPGDATTREALRVMAHTLAGPEHVAVVGDWCQSKPLANFPGEPFGGLGELVTAWLRGECWWCNGGRRYRVGSGYVAKCGHCNGHGLVLGAFEHRLHHLAEILCGPVHTAEAA